MDNDAGDQPGISAEDMVYAASRDIIAIFSQDSSNKSRFLLVNYHIISCACFDFYLKIYVLMPLMRVQCSILCFTRFIFVKGSGWKGIMA